MQLSRNARFARASQQRDRWTTSYADFVTILLTLFVALAAQATQTPAKPVVEPVKPKIAERPHALVSAFQKLERDGIKLHLESRGLVLTLEQKILFQSGDDRISDRTSAAPGPARR